jgi:hypothetical protein
MKRNKIIAIALLCAALVLVAGCGRSEEPDVPQAYVLGILDTLYRGEVSGDLLALTGTEDASVLTAEYENGLAVEADYFAHFFSTGDLSEDAAALVKEFYRDLYRLARYEAAPSIETGGAGESGVAGNAEGGKMLYTVDVTVEPLDAVLRFVDEKLNAYAQQFKAETSKDLPAAERQMLYVAGLLEGIRGYMKAPGYLEPVTIRVEVSQDAGDELYRIRGNGLTDIDEQMIRYR